jgi:hypothetical protein
MKLSLGARAILCLSIGIVITFTQSHDSGVGLIALAVFGLGFAALTTISSFAAKDKLSTIESVPITIVALIIGALALLVQTQNSAAGVDTFIALVTGWGLISGAFELFLARRAGFGSVAGRDNLITSILSLALGILFLIAPLDIVSAVGFFGAYLVVIGVHLGISATTPAKKGKGAKGVKGSNGGGTKKSKS